jgi:hypothetical protein
MSPGFINVRLCLSGLGQVVPKEVPQGTTLGALVSTLDGWAPQKTHDQILVSGTARNSSYVLADQDEISVAPANVKAA